MISKKVQKGFSVSNSFCGFVFKKKTQKFMLYYIQNNDHAWKMNSI